MSHQQQTTEMLYSKANSLLSLGESKEANRLISRLEQIDQLPEINYLKGKYAEVSGEKSKALLFYKTYFWEQPNYLTLVKLVKNALSKKKIEDVIMLGEAYLNASPNDNQARAFLSSKIMVHAPDKALQFISTRRNELFIMRNWEVSNNVAWLLLATNKPEKSLKFAQRAYELQPNNTSVLVTYASSLVQNLQPKLAIYILEEIPRPNNQISSLIKELRAQ